MAKSKYYNLTEIKKKKAHINLIFGERSNGKTTACLMEGIRTAVKNDGSFAIVRRWRDDFTQNRAASMFNAIVQMGFIKKETGGEFTDVEYSSGRWYFAKYDEDLKQTVRSEKPFCYAFALSTMEHDKSTSFPDVKIIVFDECITRKSYLADEFVIWMNTVSTIVRDRSDVTIYMIGNTVTEYCPYFDEMGLDRIKEMVPGTIDVYEYGTSGLKVAVEYCENGRSKDSNIYFAFDNPKLNMITQGGWEIGSYPHAPCEWEKKDIIFSYFIEFGNKLFQADIVSLPGKVFTFIHKKTTPLRKENEDLIFSQRFDPRPNFRRKITKPSSEVEKKIAWFFAKEKVFYDTNRTGEAIRAYLLWCATDKQT